MIDDDDDAKIMFSLFTKRILNIFSAKLIKSKQLVHLEQIRL